MFDVIWCDMSRVLVCGVLLWVTGCAEDGPVHVKGSPDDVSTAPGTYDGYRVIDDCERSSVAYAVLGTGVNWYRDAAPGDEARVEALNELATSVIEPALAGVESIGGVGLGTACAADVGVSVGMSDWREVDTVIERASGALAERDLREEVLITVTVSRRD